MNKFGIIETSRQRLRLKNSKRTWKCQKNSKYQTHKKSIKLTKRVSNSRKTQTTELARQVLASEGPWRAKRGIFLHFLTSIVAKHQIERWKKFGEQNFQKKFHNAEKNWKGGPFWIFQHPLCRKTSKNWRGDPLRNFFLEKKSHNAEKNWKGDPLVSPGMVCYAEKEEKPFWFISLGQMSQFGTIKVCRTFVELFWLVRVDWKKNEKNVTIIVAFHFMKRRLKMECLLIRNY